MVCSLLTNAFSNMTNNRSSTDFVFVFLFFLEPDNTKDLFGFYSLDKNILTNILDSLQSIY